MLDWTTCLIGVDFSAFPTGKLLRVSPDGSIDWSVDTWEQLEHPSHDASLRLRKASPLPNMIEYDLSHKRRTAIEVVAFSGNPNKWFQGHNVFGPSAIHHALLLRATLADLSQNKLIPPVSLPQNFSLHRSRVDVNINIRLDSVSHVIDWLHRASASRTRRKDALTSGTTVYWHRGSRYWTLKAYDKFSELMKRKPTRLSPVRWSEIIEQSEAVLRLEVTLLSKQLKQLDAVSEDIVLRSYYEGITMGKVINRNQEFMLDLLSRAVQSTFIRWRDATDPRSFLTCRQTYYRHRRAILDKLGLDISIPYSELSKNHTRHTIDDDTSSDYLRKRVIPDPDPDKNILRLAGVDSR